MPFPVNIEKLIEGTIVEYQRIEFKRGWNPEDVIHTMCAFANDIENIGGGYIVIGIEEEDGRPILPPSGLQRNQLDTIQKKLLELSNKIRPAYFGISEPVELQGKNIVVVYCPGGDHRPYTAPVSLSKSKKGRVYWIRRYNSTVRANHQEQQKLHEMAAQIPYDDRINHNATLDDLSLSLINEFLQKVKSPLYRQTQQIPFSQLCRQMQIAKGPDENLRPINAGLLLFNENPKEFFAGAQIDIVIYKDEIGDNFTEKSFTGPIHKQLVNVLDYIQTNVISEQVSKVEGQAESQRYYNYPFAAIEEVLANAVYHRSYQHQNAIEVNIRLDQIEVLSFPGPLPPLDNAALQEERIVARDYRNRKIGDFLKELQLTEGRATGFPKIYAAMASNGSPKPHFKTDEDRTYFLSILPIHEFVEARGQVEGQVEGQVGDIELSEKEISILEILRNKGPSSKNELLETLKMVRSGYFRRMIDKLMDHQLIAYQYPESPQSPKQKYLLTKNGKQFLRSM